MAKKNFNWVYDYSIIIIDFDVHKAMFGTGGTICMHLYEK